MMSGVSKVVSVIGSDSATSLDISCPSSDASLDISCPPPNKKFRELPPRFVMATSTPRRVMPALHLPALHLASSPVLQSTACTVPQLFRAPMSTSPLCAPVSLPPTSICSATVPAASSSTIVTSAAPLPTVQAVSAAPLPTVPALSSSISNSPINVSVSSDFHNKNDFGIPSLPFTHEHLNRLIWNIRMRSGNIC